ncbi:Transcription initiation factor TFIID subunit 5 [Bienertia sinuspersici]
MEEEEIEKAVIAYLKKKGFKQTELAFQEEQQQNQPQQQQQSKNSSSNSQTDPDVAKLILTFSSDSESLPAQYHEGYSKLRSWAYNSLDLYKHELLRVLYPVYIHCFMDLVAKGHLQEARDFFNTFREDHETMHQRDLQKLEGVLSPSHLEEMEFAHTLRQSKVNIKICQYSYDLLLQYLHKDQSMTMLGVINEHINLEVVPGPPGSISDDAEAVTLVDGGQDAANLINQKEIQWGMLEDSIEDRMEKGGGLLLDSDKVDGDNKEGENEENKKRSADVGKPGAAVKKSKKDKVGGASGKAARPEASAPSMAPRVKPELTLPVVSAEVEHSILEDLRNRVQLSSVALPSGHSGPVYSASFSPLGDFILSSSADSTVVKVHFLPLDQQTAQ